MKLEEQLAQFAHIPVKYSIPIQLAFPAESDRTVESTSAKNDEAEEATSDDDTIDTVKFVLSKLAEVVNMDNRPSGQPSVDDQGLLDNEEDFYEDEENLDIDNEIIEVENIR